MFSFIDRLGSRRNALAGKEKGFTLIELLVVVIIIGVLAAIAIPVYLGIQDSAKDASVQSDVVNAKTAVVTFQSTTGALPATPQSDLGQVVGITKAGFTQGIPNLAFPITFTGDTAGFCIVAKSVTGSVYYATDSSGAIKVTTATPLPTTGCTTPTTGTLTASK